MKVNSPVDFLFLLSIFCSWCFFSSVQTNSSIPLSTTAKPLVAHVSSSNSSTVTPDTGVTGKNENDTATNNQNSAIFNVQSFSLDNGAVKRTFYVVASLTGLVLVYIAVKAIRSSRKKKVRRYGLLIDQEMEPLDGDDGDEDTTLFDANRYKKKIKN